MQELTPSENPSQKLVWQVQSWPTTMLACRQLRQDCSQMVTTVFFCQRCQWQPPLAPPKSCSTRKQTTALSILKISLNLVWRSYQLMFLVVVLSKAGSSLDSSKRSRRSCMAPLTDKVMVATRFVSISSNHILKGCHIVHLLLCSRRCKMVGYRRALAQLFQISTHHNLPASGSYTFYRSFWH